MRGEPRGGGRHRTRGARPSIQVAFRVAAGPRLGFGHLVRAIHLAGALGVPPRVSIRGSETAAETARRLGVSLLPAVPGSVLGRDVALLVLDDPSRLAAEPWLRAARRAGVRVVSIHDIGLAPLASDLAIDGSLGARRVDGLGRDAAACRLGPAFAILAPSLARLRRPPVVATGRPTIVIGLGGGRHAATGIGIATHLLSTVDRRAMLGARVMLSLGLDSAGVDARDLPRGIRLIPAATFRTALSRATVAVVAGGTTLYEACALGIPVVAVPVVPGQAETIRRFVRAGLAVSPRGGAGVTGGVGTARGDRAAAVAALALLDDVARQRALSRRGREVIDGQGAARVAAAIGRLLQVTTKAGTRP